jgi:uncharacterized protein (DUF1810 family)
LVAAIPSLPLHRLVATAEGITPQVVSWLMTGQLVSQYLTFIFDPDIRVSCTPERWFVSTEQCQRSIEGYQQAVA